MKNYIAKKSIIGFAIITTVILFAFSGSHPTTGTGGYTGAPNDNVCTTCHDPGGNLDGTIEISGLPASVTPSTTYPLTVTITDTSPGGVAVRSGFQMVSLKEDDTNAGTFVVGSGESNAVVKTIAGKSYIGHEPAKNFSSADIVTFNVDWTAPASATGDITLYGASMIANGANGNDNDKFVMTNVVTTLESGGAPLAISFTNVIDASCSDSSDGSATVNATGGSGTYTYNWDNGETNETATMLDAGTHTVTVTDASSASIFESVTIGAPAPINFSVISLSNAICNGTNTGTAEVIATGGTPNFFYDWGSSITGAIQNNLSAGFYTITATDGNGCESTITLTIDEPAPISINTISTTEPICNGESSGSVTVEANGGNGGFTYNWVSGGVGIPNGGTLSSIPSGSYLVEVFDIENCSNEIEIILGEPDPIVPTLNATDINCFGGSDGTATASAIGGTGTITFDWSNGGSGATQNNLATGMYSVTASDNNGCSVADIIEISGPAEELTAGITPTNNPNCGNTDGTLTAFANGGTPGYSFLWNTGGTSAILDNIPSGIYSVVVTDDNGCTTESEFTLIDNDGVSLVANDVTDNSCNGGSEGSATISATGGSGTYTYDWSSGGTSETETGLPAGTYSVIVSDENNCTSEIVIEIAQPSEILANETVTNITCGGAENGAITIAPAGGTGDLTVLWNTGSTDTTIENLAPNTYTVVITDANDCTEEIGFNIEQPDQISLENSDISLPECVGENNGTIAVNGVGGTGTLTYDWSDGTSGPNLMNASAGDYALSVTDENDCVVEFSFTINDPESIGLTSSSIMPTCSDSSDGSITAMGDGGTGNLSYSWNDGTQSATLSDIPAGEYTVVISDENGCEYSESLILEGPDAIDPNISSTNETENGANDGTATANPLNGTAPYEYLWSTNETTAIIADLEPGVYTVIITDANGCTQEGSVIVNSGDCALVATPMITNVSCFDMADGSISVELEGATEPITYSWNNDSTDPILQNLNAGTYSVVITDGNNCQIQIEDIEVSQPEEITASDPIITNASNSSASDGMIEIEFSGGVGSYEIQFTDNGGNVLDNLENLAAGSYNIIVTDENGCMKEFGPYLVDITSSTNEEVIKATLYPNPVSAFLTIEIDNDLESAPQLYALTGQLLRVAISKINGAYQVDLSAIGNGIYYVKLTTKAGSELKKIIVAK